MILVDTEVATMDAALWDHAMSVNLRSLMLGTKHALRHMLERQRGSIIYTSSVIAQLGGTILAAHAASKSGVNALMRCVATAYGKRGIRANALAPGVIRTPANETLFDDASRDIF